MPYSLTVALLKSKNPLRKEHSMDSHFVLSVYLLIQVTFLCTTMNKQISSISFRYFKHVLKTQK